jgi:hypothetical protein
MPKSEPAFIDPPFLYHFKRKAAPARIASGSGIIAGRNPAATLAQPGKIASVGQTAAQEPQSVHLSGSIQRRPFFSEIASTGHSGSQAPQFTQASVTL